MKTYEVFFNQVNQSRYEVKASSRDEAINKAAKEWRRDNDMPSLEAVQVGN